MRAGRARSSRPRRSGSSPPAAGSRAPSSAGGTSSRRTGGRWPTPGRATSRARTSDRRLRVDGARRLVPAERLRPPRDGRERLGVDDGLVQPHGELVKPCCTRANPRGGEPESRATTRAPRAPIPRKVMKGGSLPLRAELLPALPAGGADGAADRHLDLASRLPLHRPSRAKIDDDVRFHPYRATRAQPMPRVIGALKRELGKGISRLSE